jgi:hypothetical protein
MKKEVKRSLTGDTNQPPEQKRVEEVEETRIERQERLLRNEEKDKDSDNDSKSKSNSKKK